MHSSNRKRHPNFGVRTSGFSDNCKHKAESNVVNIFEWLKPSMASYVVWPFQSILLTVKRNPRSKTRPVTFNLLNDNTHTCRIFVLMKKKGSLLGKILEVMLRWAEAEIGDWNGIYSPVSLSALVSRTVKYTDKGSYLQFTRMTWQ
jgi:hypothetical protein